MLHTLLGLYTLGFFEGGSEDGPPDPPPPDPPTLTGVTMLTIRKRLSFMFDSDIEVLRKQSNLLANLAENHALTAPGLAIGTADKADILIANTVQYVRNGERRADKTTAEVAISSDAAMPNDGASREVGLLVCIDPDDDFVTISGPVISGGGEAILPDLPVGYVLLGYVTIRAAAGTAFVPGTTLLDAAGITDVYASHIRPTWQLAQLLDVNARV